METAYSLEILDLVVDQVIPTAILRWGIFEPSPQSSKKTLNPVWDQKFNFIVPDAEEKLLIEIFDEDLVGKDDQLGTLEIPLKPLVNKGYSEQAYNITKPDGKGTYGTLTIGINFTASPNQQVMIETLSRENQILRGEVQKISQRYKLASEQLAKIVQISKEINDKGSEVERNTRETYEHLNELFPRAQK